jgi:hypothetical protein
LTNVEDGEDDFDTVTLGAEIKIKGNARDINPLFYAVRYDVIGVLGLQQVN